MNNCSVLKIVADFVDPDTIADENGFTYSKLRPYKNTGEFVDWRYNCDKSHSLLNCQCYIRVRSGEIIGRYFDHNHSPFYTE